MPTRSGSKGESSTTHGGRATNGRAAGGGTNGGKGATAAASTDDKTVTVSATNDKGVTATVTNLKDATAGTAASRSRRRSPKRTAAATAAGTTVRARLGATRSKARAAGRPKKDDIPIVDPTVPADDKVMAASNARRALNPDMPRVAWLRTQLNQMEARQRERLLKAGALTLIAIVFITFVLQNAQPVNVHFLFFALNIRLIWVIFGCALLGAAAGYLIGRPEKSLRAMFPQREKKHAPGRTSKA